MRQWLEQLAGDSYRYPEAGYRKLIGPFAAWPYAQCRLAGLLALEGRDDEKGEAGEAPEPRIQGPRLDDNRSRNKQRLSVAGSACATRRRYAAFFFDVYDEDTSFRDEEGTELSDHEAARNSAMKLLPEMARDEVPRDGDRRAFTVVISDADRKAIYTATLSYAGLWLVP